MPSISPITAEKLSFSSQQLRESALRRERHAQSIQSGGMSIAEIADALSRMQNVKQVGTRRLLQAIELGNLSAAEENLQLALNVCARAKALNVARLVADHS